MLFCVIRNCFHHDNAPFNIHSTLGLVIGRAMLGSGQACVIGAFVEKCLETQVVVKNKEPAKKCSL